MNLDLLLPARRECCSDLDLDRFALGELDGAEAERLDAHLASSPACAARLQALQGEPAPRPLAVLPVGGRRPPPKASRLTMSTSAGVAMAAACVALFVVVRDDAAGGDLRKGVDDIEVYARSAGATSGAVLLKDGARVAPGDRLRFVVHSARPRTAAVLAVDGAGALGVYAAPRDVQAGRTELPGAIELDDVRGRERLTLFLCDGTVATDTLALLTDAVRAGTTPAGCRATALTLEKP